MVNNTYDSWFYDSWDWDDNWLYDDLQILNIWVSKWEIIRDDNIDITSSFNYNENT